MRKFFLSLAAAASVLAVGFVGNRAEAFTIGTPAGLAAAAEDIAVVDKVHCRPGWQHHYPTQWRRANGCRRYHQYGYHYGYVAAYPILIHPGRIHRHRFVHRHRFHHRHAGFHRHVGFHRNVGIHRHARMHRR